MKKIRLILMMAFVFTACACAAQKDQLEVPKAITSPHHYTSDADAPMIVQNKSELQEAKPPCMEIQLKVKISDPVDNQSSFRTIKEALDYAQSRSYCMINIQAERGTYPENLEITRPTKISPATRVNITITGSILNSKGFDLNLENIVMLNVQDYALLMTGNGNLTLKDFYVRATRLNPNDIKTGTAIELHDGVQGHFNHVNLENNDGVALYINGANTKVIARNFNVFNNRVHPLAIQQKINDMSSLSRLSAVDVASGATLLVDGFYIYSNEMTGVLARDSGKVLLNNGYVEGTSDYDIGQSNSIGGNNIMAAQNGVVEMNNVESRYAKECGLHASNSYMKIQNGNIHHNAIGTCAFGSAAENYDIIKCVMNNTTHYHDNEVNIQTPSISVPDTNCSSSNPPPECNQPPNCPGVPWIE